MKLARAILFAALVAAAVVAAAGLGYRFGLWPLQQAFDMLRIGAWASAGVLAISALGLFWLMWRRRFVGVLLTLPALVVAAAALYPPWQMAQLAQSYPPLHDISTDLETPPEFVALKAERAQATNGAGWSGDAALQRQHYPGIAPLTLKLAIDQAFAAAESAAREMGWTIASADAAGGRLEASTRSLWFGFTDDVVVRLRAEGDTTHLDVRSASREGVGDLGKNAERIGAYLERLKAATP